MSGPISSATNQPLIGQRHVRIEVPVGESQPDDVGKRPAFPGGIPYDFAFSLFHSGLIACSRARRVTLMAIGISRRRGHSSFS